MAKSKQARRSPPPAAPKKKRNAAAATKAKTAPAPAPAAAVIDPPSRASEQAEQVEFVRMRLMLPTVRDDEREAYDSRFSDDECTEAGGKTRAPEVLTQARRLAITVASDVLKHSELLNYSATRFSYLMDHIETLEEHVAMQTATRKGGVAKRSSFVAAEAAVKSASAKAESIFDDLLGGKRRGAFEATRQAALQAEDPGAELSQWCKLAREMSESGDKQAATLLSAAAVTSALIEAWEALAVEYRTVRQKTQADPLVARDLPATNRVEGRVLLEISLLYNSFVRAKASGAAMSVPTLGPSLLRIAKPSAKAKKKQGETPTPEAPKGEKKDQTPSPGPKG